MTPDGICSLAELQEDGIALNAPEQVPRGAVFIDNSTLSMAAEVLEGVLDNPKLSSDVRSTRWAEVNNLLEALVLYDETYVDACGVWRCRECAKVHYVENLL